MVELIKSLCELDAVSGDEFAVRDFIISQIDGFCEWKTDALGNIIAFKKGEKRPAQKVMVDAHMDEVGLIITSITSDGFLKFKTVGGIETPALMFRKVKINGNINGVISGKPIHLISASEAKKMPEKESLYIDIGAKDREEAEKTVKIGDMATFDVEFNTAEEKIISKALDDRIGCALLIMLLRKTSKYDFYATFSVQEELGCRGAKTATFSVAPQSAIVLEGTTAADIAEVIESKTVCKLGDGPVVSAMDLGTVYDKAYYNAALSSGIICQPKKAVTGGNNSSAIHLSNEGVRTLAISAPCRYIHSSSSVANINDCENALNLCEYMLNGICSGEIK